MCQVWRQKILLLLLPRNASRFSLRPVRWRCSSTAQCRIVRGLRRLNFQSLSAANKKGVCSTSLEDYPYPPALLPGWTYYWGMGRGRGGTNVNVGQGLDRLWFASADSTLAGQLLVADCKIGQRLRSFPPPPGLSCLWFLQRSWYSET